MKVAVITGTGALISSEAVSGFHDRTRQIGHIGDHPRGDIPPDTALKTFKSMGCIVEEAQPNYPIEAVWQAWLRLRAWQNGGMLLAYYNDPAKRALLKPEAIFEVESGSKLTAFDITAASVVRTE